MEGNGSFADAIRAGITGLFAKRQEEDNILTRAVDLLDQYSGNNTNTNQTNTQTYSQFNRGINNFKESIGGNGAPQNTNNQNQIPQVSQNQVIQQPNNTVPLNTNYQGQMPQVAQGGYEEVSTPLMSQDKYMQPNGKKKSDADNQKKGTTKKVKKTKGNSGRKRESYVDEDERINAKYRALNNSLQQGYGKSRW